MKFFIDSANLGEIKEAASLGGSVEGLVPDIVCRRLRDKYRIRELK